MVSALMVLGAAACSGDTVSAESGNTTTSSSSTDDSVADTSDSAMTDTETDTDDGPDDSPTTSGSFYAGPEPDWGGSSECDPFAQDCPDGEKCVPYASEGGTWDANKCVPVVGDGQPGEPCTYNGVIEAIDDCDESGICWDVVEIEGELVGTCTEFCTGTADNPQCGEGAFCLIANEGSINLCIDTCDPQASMCPDGQDCTWSGDGYACLPSTPPGQSCEAAECPASSVCVQAQVLPECESSACCAPYCSVSDPMCEQPGTVCVPLYDRDPPPGAEDVGLCLLPE